MPRYLLVDLVGADLVGLAGVDDLAPAEDVDGLGQLKAFCTYCSTTTSDMPRFDQLGQGLVDLVDHERGQAQGRLVDQDQLGAGEVGPGQGQHLLLAAGQAAGGLAQPAAEDGEQFG